MANLSDGVLLELGSVLKLKRQLEQNILEMTNLRRSLAGIAVRRHQNVYMPPDAVLFTNAAGAEVPAYGVMKVTGVDSNGRVTVAKPDSTFQRLYLVNGPLPVASGSKGEGTWLTSTSRTDRNRYVLYNTSSGTPAYGETWGPKADQWSLEKHYYGFLIQGGNTGADAAARTVAVQSEVHRVLAKLDGSLAQGSSATASVWKRTSAGTGWEDSGQNITVYDWILNTGESVDADTKFVAEFAGNCWVATGAYCAADDVGA